jgi:uncharacterized protein YceK
MKITKSIVLIAATGLVISGCASIEMSSGGEKVRVLAPNEVSSCKHLGKTTNSVTAKVAGVKRPIETIEKELMTMGRNSASDMGGDTIVPLTVVTDGKQSFSIYKCVNPDG